MRSSLPRKDWNTARGTATSANWNTNRRAWRTSLAPILMDLTWRLRSDQSLMAWVVEVDLDGGRLTVDYDGSLVDYDFTELDELPAYAVSVHRSQCSEYPAVVVPVMTQHYRLLQRNLLYTAVTRARSLAVLVGTTKAIGIAVRNRKVGERHTGLAERLSTGPFEPGPTSKTDSPSRYWAAPNPPSHISCGPCRDSWPRHRVEPDDRLQRQHGISTMPVPNVKGPGRPSPAEVHMLLYPQALSNADTRTSTESEGGDQCESE